MRAQLLPSCVRHFTLLKKTFQGKILQIPGMPKNCVFFERITYLVQIKIWILGVQKKRSLQSNTASPPCSWKFTIMQSLKDPFFYKTANYSLSDVSSSEHLCHLNFTVDSHGFHLFVQSMLSAKKLSHNCRTIRL